MCTAEIKSFSVLPAGISGEIKDVISDLVELDGDSGSIVGDRMRKIEKINHCIETLQDCGRKLQTMPDDDLSLNVDRRRAWKEDVMSSLQIYLEHTVYRLYFAVVRNTEWKKSHLFSRYRVILDCDGLQTRMRHVLERGFPHIFSKPLLADIRACLGDEYVESAYHKYCADAECSMFEWVLDCFSSEMREISYKSNPDRLCYRTTKKPAMYPDTEISMMSIITAETILEEEFFRFLDSLLGRLYGVSRRCESAG